MAKKEQSPKNVLERQYTIPLKKDTIKVPFYRKAKKAISSVRSFISRHMKSDDILISTHLNKEIWKHGMKNPPKKVKVTATKNDKGKVIVNLFGAPKVELNGSKDKKTEEEKTKKLKEEKKETEKKIDDKKKEITQKIKESLPKNLKEKSDENKVEPKKEVETKKIEKEEIKPIAKPKSQHAPKIQKIPKNVEKQANAPKQK